MQQLVKDFYLQTHHLGMDYKKLFASENEITVEDIFKHADTLSPIKSICAKNNIINSFGEKKLCDELSFHKNLDKNGYFKPFKPFTSGTFNTFEEAKLPHDFARRNVQGAILHKSLNECKYLESWNPLRSENFIYTKEGMFNDTKCKQLSEDSFPNKNLLTTCLKKDQPSASGLRQVYQNSGSYSLPLRSNTPDIYDNQSIPSKIKESTSKRKHVHFDADVYFPIGTHENFPTLYSGASVSHNAYFGNNSKNTKNLFRRCFWPLIFSDQNCLCQEDLVQMENFSTPCELIAHVTNLIESIKLRAEDIISKTDECQINYKKFLNFNNTKCNFLTEQCLCFDDNYSEEASSDEDDAVSLKFEDNNASNKSSYYHESQSSSMQDTSFQSNYGRILKHPISDDNYNKHRLAAKYFPNQEHHVAKHAIFNPDDLHNCNHIKIDNISAADEELNQDIYVPFLDDYPLQNNSKFFNEFFSPRNKNSFPQKLKNKYDHDNNFDVTFNQSPIHPINPTSDSCDSDKNALQNPDILHMDFGNYASKHRLKNDVYTPEHRILNTAKVNKINHFSNTFGDINPKTNKRQKTDNWMNPYQRVRELHGDKVLPEGLTMPIARYVADNEKQQLLESNQSKNIQKPTSSNASKTASALSENIVDFRKLKELISTYDDIHTNKNSNKIITFGLQNTKPQTKNDQIYQELETKSPINNLFDTESPNFENEKEEEPRLNDQKNLDNGNNVGNKTLDMDEQNKTLEKMKSPIRDNFLDSEEQSGNNYFQTESASIHSIEANGSKKQTIKSGLDIKNSLNPKFSTKSIDHLRKTSEVFANDMDRINKKFENNYPLSQKFSHDIDKPIHETARANSSNFLSQVFSTNRPTKTDDSLIADVKTTVPLAAIQQSNNQTENFQKPIKTDVDFPQEALDLHDDAETNETYLPVNIVSYNGFDIKPEEKKIDQDPHTMYNNDNVKKRTSSENNKIDVKPNSIDQNPVGPLKENVFEVIRSSTNKMIDDSSLALNKSNSLHPEAEKFEENQLVEQKLTSQSSDHYNSIEINIKNFSGKKDKPDTNLATQKLSDEKELKRTGFDTHKIEISPSGNGLSKRRSGASVQNKSDSGELKKYNPIKSVNEIYNKVDFVKNKLATTIQRFSEMQLQLSENSMRTKSVDYIQENVVLPPLSTQQNKSFSGFPISQTLDKTRGKTKVELNHALQHSTNSLTHEKTSKAPNFKANGDTKMKDLISITNH